MDQREKDHGSCEPVEWRGALYSSHKECAKAANRHPTTVGYHLKRYGNLDRLGAGKGVHSNHHPSSKARPIGRWPSARALAKAAGLPPKRVQRWRREGREEELMLAQMLADKTGKNNE